MVKAGFKMLIGLLAGITFGFVVAAAIVVIFTDTTIPVFIENLRSAKVLELAFATLVGMVAFLMSLVILILAHEAGHLVCGLLSGYKFVSFRIFNIVFIKDCGLIRVKRFSVAGTGGQCLLMPPDLPLEDIPMGWYNAGGILANVFLLLAVLPLFWVDISPWIFEALMIFCLTDVFLIFINGIPMKVSGIGNDAYNMICMRHNMRSKLGVVLQLRSNALIQDGVRPKDMPNEWFEWTTEVDFKNPLELSIPLMYASRLVDEMNWEEAYVRFEELYARRKCIMGLYVNEIACELAFCAMVTGHKERAQELLDKQLLKYIESYSKVMSSKLRVLCAKALYLDNDKSKAIEILKSLESSKDNYLLKGEVESDLAILRALPELT